MASNTYSFINNPGEPISKVKLPCTVTDPKRPYARVTDK